jgi:hypothetical protein
MRTGVGDAGDDESEVGAGAPIVAGFFRADFAEDAEQAFGVGREEFGLLFGDAACGIGGVMTEDGVASEERF